MNLWIRARQIKFRERRLIFVILNVFLVWFARIINYKLYNFVYSVWELCFEILYVQMTNNLDSIDEIDWKELIDWDVSIELIEIFKIKFKSFCKWLQK